MSILLSFLASVLASVFTYLLIFCLRPKLKIVPKPLNESNIVKFSIENIGRFDVHNVQVEACAYYTGDGNTPNQTFRFEVVGTPFLILPSQSTDSDFSKIFYTNALKISTLEFGSNFTDILSDIKNDKCILRIRVHAQHSVSGLGKSLQKKFRFTQNQFKEVE